MLHAHRRAVRHHDPFRERERLRRSMLLTVVVYLLPVAFLLRKKKLPEVQLYWGAYTQK